MNEVEKILPRGGNEWETVTKNYNIARLNPLSGMKDRPERQGDSCKIKFKSMKNVKKPTGDPTLPADIKRSKLIQKKIEERMSCADFDDDDDVDYDDDGVQGNDTDEAANGTLIEYAIAECHDSAQDEADDGVADRATRSWSSSGTCCSKK